MLTHATSPQTPAARSFAAAPPTDPAHFLAPNVETPQALPQGLDNDAPNSLTQPLLRTIAPATACRTTALHALKPTAAHDCHAFQQLLRRPQYRRNFCVMLSYQAGLGVIDGGINMWLDTLTSQHHSLPLVFNGILLLSKEIPALWGRVQAHSQRDKQDAPSLALRLPPSLQHIYFNQRLVAYSGIDLLCIAALLGCMVWQFAGQKGLLTLLAINRGIIFYSLQRQLGFYNCLKLYLDEALAQAAQRQHNRALVGIEIGVLRLLEHIPNLSLYLIACYFLKTPQAMQRCALQTILAGGLLACAPKLLVFTWQTRQLQHPQLPRQHV